LDIEVNEAFFAESLKDITAPLLPKSVQGAGLYLFSNICIYRRYIEKIRRI